MTKLLKKSCEQELTITPSEALDIVRDLSSLILPHTGGVIPRVSAGYNGESAAFYIDRDIDSNYAKQIIESRCTYFCLSMSAAKDLIVCLVNSLDYDKDVQIIPEMQLKDDKGVKINFSLVVSKIY